MSEAGSPGVKLGVADVLSTTARVIGARSAPFLLIAALGATPGSILMTVVNHFLQAKLMGMASATTAGNPDAIMDVLGGMAVLYAGLMGALVVHMLLTYTAQAVLVRGTIDWIGGRSPDLSEMVRTAMPRVPSVLGVVLLRGLAQVGAMMPGMIIGLVMMAGVGGVAGGLANGHAGGGETAAIGVIGMLCAMPIMMIAMIVPMTYIAILLTGSQYLMVIRILRLLRMFRVLKMAHHFGQANVLMNALRNSGPKIAVFLFGMLVLVCLEGTLMYLIEGGINEGFASIPQSIYWAIVTVTTVGYGDVAPVTVVGKMIASLVMLSGFSIIAVPTGIVTAEIGREMRQVKMDSRECSQCGWTGHDPAANYCKHCGNKLHV